MGSKLILWFDEIGRDFVSTVGGKSANLGEMARIGVPVPEGFAITTESYERFMGETGAHAEIKEFFTSFPEGPQGTSQIQEASRKIRQIIEAKEIPQDIKDCITSHYSELCDRCGVENMPVAVRSSGVAEDLNVENHFSFLGSSALQTLEAP